MRNLQLPAGKAERIPVYDHIHEREIVTFVNIGRQADTLLFQIADTGRFLSGFPGSSPSRQQHGGKDGDDGNHHQQFDQGKSFFHLIIP